jgi:K+-dependent Na+/Ca+ exchanger-like protein
MRLSCLASVLAAVSVVLAACEESSKESVEVEPQLLEEAKTCFFGEKSVVVGYTWFIFIMFMFFAQHHVCDAYFVPAINVFVDKMRGSSNPWLQRWGDQAVAGATICALGCNGPELFCNMIALYTGSDAGIGVVVGSEIFNLLIIVGAAVMCAPILPLQLERSAFTRDVIFYGISILLLYFFLLDGKITTTEAWILLGAAVVYVGTVYATEDIVNCVFGKKNEAEQVSAGNAAESGTRGKIHGIIVLVEEVLHSRMADGRKSVANNWDMQPTEHGIYAESQQDLSNVKPNERGSLGFQFLKPNAMLGPILPYQDLTEVVVMGEGVIHLEFKSRVRRVTMKCTCESAAARDELLKLIEVHSLGSPWVHGYDSSVMSAFAHLNHALKRGKCFEILGAFAEFIIDVPLKLTLSVVDVKDIKKEGRWPICFLGAMAWLAVFSYLMLEIAEDINCNTGLPSSFLGITVCAIGTSFPNAVASIIMAQQNKPAAAIANALGSNVQNVFLAMAVPWVIYLNQQGLSIMAVGAEGIDEGVAWMAATLILVVFFVLLPAFCTLNKCHGYVLIFAYFAYLVLTSGETFGWFASPFQMMGLA